MPTNPGPTSPIPIRFMAFRPVPFGAQPPCNPLRMLQHFATGLLALLPLLEDQLCRKLHLARDVVARARNRTEIRVPQRTVWDDEIRRVRHVVDLRSKLEL